MSLEKMMNLEKMNPEDSSYDLIRDEAIALNESIALMKKIDYEKFLEETKATMMVTGCRSYMAAKEESKCQGNQFFYNRSKPLIFACLSGAISHLFTLEWRKSLCRE